MHPENVPDIRARELLTVVALAEYGSFVAAAAHLKTSQPALTRAIKRIERILGVTLFARSTRRVEITAAGREFLAVAERVLNDLQLTVRNLGDVSNEQRGRVTISTYSAFSAHALPELVRTYRETRPLIEIRVREGRQSEIIEDVRSGAADFGVGYVDVLPENMQSAALRREPLYALIPTRHPLAARKRRRIRLAELRNEPLVAGPSSTYLRRLIDGAAAASGITLHYSVTVDRLLTILHHVSVGGGLAILPAGCLPRLMWGEGFHAAVLTQPSLSVVVGLITLRGRLLTPAASGMVSLIRTHAGKGNS